MRVSPFRGRYRRTMVTFAVLAVAHLWPSAPLIGQETGHDPGAGQQAPIGGQAVLSGRLAVIWEDPLPGRGAPNLRHFLATDDGRLVPLRADESHFRFLGGPLAADGRFVDVSGRWTGRRTAPGASAARELEVSEVRASAAPPGASVAPSPSGAPIMGSYPWVTVLCRFADAPTVEPHPLSWYGGLMSGTEPGLDHYWREVSYDQANVAGSQAVGWYDLPEDHSAYVDGDNADLEKLKNDCAAAADADIHFPDYVGINLQFNQPLGSFSWGGGASLNIDGENRFYRMTWLADWADHVTYAHEMGHGFGLPHSSGPYGAVYDSNWDVMSGSWTHHDPTWGWLAPHTISYHKDMLGWIPAGRILDLASGDTRTVVLHRLADLGAGGDYLMARIPLPDGSHYTVEARRHVGYDAYIPAEAVILHHVTDRAYVVDPDGNGNPDDSGARWLPGETFDDDDNGVSVRVEARTAEGYRVTISVAEPGIIALDPPGLAFAAQQGVDPPDQQVTLTNAGTGSLVWSATADASWLTLAQSSGTLGPGGSLDIGLEVGIEGLAVGTYVGEVTVVGNAGNSPQTVEVSLNLSAAPVITLIAEPLRIETAIGVVPPPQEILIRNDGDEPLDWIASASPDWIGLTGSSGTLDPGASVTDTIRIDVEGLGIDTHTGSVTVSGNAPNSPQSLQVRLEVTESPSIALTEPPDFAFWEGDTPGTHDFQVTNDGGGTLHWTASADSAWVTLPTASGSLGSGGFDVVPLGVDASALGPGTHDATVTVEGNADDSPQSFDVRVVVEARPDLALRDVVDHLLGVRTTLDAGELTFLDEIGNGNGGFDVGDFRAWLRIEGLTSAVAPVGGGEVTP